MVTISILASAVLGKAALAENPVYQVKSVDRMTQYAGKYGDLVMSETLTVSKDGETITIHVKGTYHTRFVSPGKTVHEGDMISFHGRMNGKDMVVDLDAIKIVKK